MVLWLWGGFSVDSPTLTRFYTFHFILPFLVSGVTVLHVFYLHIRGSSSPLGVVSKSDSVAFHVYFSYKDLFGFVVFASLLLTLVLFQPYFLIEVDNFVPANPLITPTHIVPEWYFLFAYAILRAFSSKLGGVVSLFCSLLILGLLPFTHSQLMKGLTYYGPVKAFF